MCKYAVVDLEMCKVPHGVSEYSGFCVPAVR